MCDSAKHTLPILSTQGSYSPFLLTPRVKTSFLVFPPLRQNSPESRGWKANKLPNCTTNPDKPLHLPPKGQVLPGREQILLPTCLYSQGRSSKPRNTSTKQRAEKCCFLFHTYSTVKKNQCHKNRDVAPRFSSCSLSRSKIYTTAHVSITQKSMLGWGETCYPCPKFSMECIVSSQWADCVSSHCLAAPSCPGFPPAGSWWHKALQGRRHHGHWGSGPCFLHQQASRGPGLYGTSHIHTLPPHTTGPAFPSPVCFLM